MKIFEQHSDHVSLDSIKKYLNDQMSNEEMHVFERHLLDCKFCNEALEGYQLSNELTIQGSLDRLKNRLDNRVKVRARPRLGIAAVVIFLLCFSIVLTFLVLDDPESEISMVEKSEKKAMEESISEPDQLEQSEEIVEDIKPEIELKSDEIPLGEKSKKAVSSKKTKSIPQITTLPTTELAAIENDIDSFGAGDVELEVLEEVFAEEEFATDFLEDNETIELASNENVLQERKLTVPSSQPKDARSKSFDTERSRNLQTVASRLNFDSRNILSSNAKPISGIDKYRLYLIDSLRYPEKAKFDKLEGEVKLVFQVTKNGNIENLKITKSLTLECDLEAQRLVFEGQKWSLVDNTLPEENNVVNLTVHFKLSD